MGRMAASAGANSACSAIANSAIPDTLPAGNRIFGTRSTLRTAHTPAPPMASQATATPRTPVRCGESDQMFMCSTVSHCGTCADRRLRGANAMQLTFARNHQGGPLTRIVPVLQPVREFPVTRMFDDVLPDQLPYDLRRSDIVARADLFEDFLLARIDEDGEACGSVFHDSPLIGRMEINI